MMGEIRVYSIVVSAIVVILGTAQVRNWLEHEPPIRLLWLSAAVLNFTVLVGSIEALSQGVRGGYRVYFTALGVTWLLATVSYRPVWAIRARISRRKKEKS